MRVYETGICNLHSRYSRSRWKLHQQQALRSPLRMFARVLAATSSAQLRTCVGRSLCRCVINRVLTEGRAESFTKKHEGAALAPLTTWT